MNIEEYISSGVLELYATGVLLPEEKAEVERTARQYPAVQAELDLILAALDRYAQLHAVTPPAHLREKVLNAVSQANVKPGPKLVTDNNLLTDNTTAGRVIPISKAPDQAVKKEGFNLLVAAAVTLLILSNVLSFYFYRNWKNAEEQYTQALASQQQYAQNIQQVKQQLMHNQQTLDLLTESATLRVVLAGVAQSPEAKATVYWNKPSQKLLISVNNLPAAPAGKQYQLWAIENGKPQDAGLIDSAQSGQPLVPMKNVADAQAFAITLEPQGGSVNPTLEAMVVMGKI